MADEENVSKSVQSIVVIGATGVILMSLMMKHLGEVMMQHGESPYSAAVQARLGSKLVGPVRIAEREFEGRRQLRARATVLSGLPKQQLADEIGGQIWFGAMRAGDAPDEIVVMLTDDLGEETLERKVAAPSRRR